MTDQNPSLAGLHRPVSPVRMAARDRRTSAVHEAGHFIIGRHVGLKNNQAWITETGRATKESKGWAGQHNSLTRELNRLSIRRQIMVAVAGFVAERCWEQAIVPEGWQIDIETALWDSDAMSPTDWAAAYCDPGTADARIIRCCEAVEALLCPGGRLRPALVAASRELISARSVGPGFMMKEAITA